MDGLERGSIGSLDEAMDAYLDAVIKQMLASRVLRWNLGLQPIAAPPPDVPANERAAFQAEIMWRWLDDVGGLLRWRAFHTDALLDKSAPRNSSLAHSIVHPDVRSATRASERSFANQLSVAYDALKGQDISGQLGQLQEMGVRAIVSCEERVRGADVASASWTKGLSRNSEASTELKAVLVALQGLPEWDTGQHSAILLVQDASRVERKWALAAPLRLEFVDALSVEAVDDGWRTNIVDTIYIAMLEWLVSCKRVEREALASALAQWKTERRSVYDIATLRALCKPLQIEDHLREVLFMRAQQSLGGTTTGPSVHEHSYTYRDVQAMVLCNRLEADDAAAPCLALLGISHYTLGKKR